MGKRKVCSISFSLHTVTSPSTDLVRELLKVLNEIMFMSKSYETQVEIIFQVLGWNSCFSPEQQQPKWTVDTRQWESSISLCICLASCIRQYWSKGCCVSVCCSGMARKHEESNNNIAGNLKKQHYFKNLFHSVSWIAKFIYIMDFCNCHNF
jgi:hypothetical protein